MTHRLVQVLVAACVALCWLAATAAPAAAITGGRPDGDDHPAVAFTAYYTADGLSRCTATLVSPRVLLTAAHCTHGAVGRTLVTFDSVIAETPQGVLPVAGDPRSGYSATELGAAGYRSARGFAHPAYSDFTDRDTWNDVGVLVLDEPVTGIDPEVLAEPGHLDRYDHPLLSQTRFTAVGYGTHIAKPESGPRKPQEMDFPLLRRSAVMPGQKLTGQILVLNGNEHHARGTGGICGGDSGGPVLHEGVVVAVTSFTYTAHCRYLTGHQRVDLEGVQAWLARFDVPVGG